MGGVYARAEGHARRGVEGDLLPLPADRRRGRRAADAARSSARPPSPGRRCRSPTSSTRSSGLFAAGEKPTGSRDPFGLRRAAQGVVKILVDVPSRRSGGRDRSICRRDSEGYGLFAASPEADAAGRLAARRVLLGAEAHLFEAPGFRGRTRSGRWCSYWKTAAVRSTPASVEALAKDRAVAGIRRPWRRCSNGSRTSQRTSDDRPDSRRICRPARKEPRSSRCSTESMQRLAERFKAADRPSALLRCDARVSRAAASRSISSSSTCW